jgi:hypothetical protein
MGGPAEVVICAAKGTGRGARGRGSEWHGSEWHGSEWHGSEWHIGPRSVGLVYRSLGVRLELSDSFRPCDGGDCPLALVQIDRLSKGSLGRTATAEQAQHVRESEAGIGLQCQ